MREGEPLWIFLHIPKCGGTTFKAHVEAHLPLEEQFFEFSNWGRRYRADHDLPEFADRPAEERARAQVLAGHQLGWGIHRLVPGTRDVRYFSVLRDPAERCVSLYNYRWSRGHAPDDFHIWYRDWYRPEQSNFQTRFLAERLYDGQLPEAPDQWLAMAETLLKQCWFVTTTDRWNEGLDHIFDAMGLPADWQHYRKAGESLALPVSHPAQSEKLARRFAADAETSAMIAADSSLDVKLVAWVRANSDRWPTNARFASTAESP
jgi:Sulfotransferase family